MIFVTEVAALRPLLKSKALVSREPVYIRLPELDPAYALARELAIQRLKAVPTGTIALKTTLVALALAALGLLHLPGWQAGWSAAPRWLVLVPLWAGPAAWLGVRMWVSWRIKGQIRLIIRYLHASAAQFAAGCVLD